MQLCFQQRRNWTACDTVFLDYAVLILSRHEFSRSIFPYSVTGAYPKYLLELANLSLYSVKLIALKREIYKLKHKTHQVIM